ncbi:MAG: HAD family hydrolase [Cyanobacteria bacterium]|nr:HAD family hydrolase [Cyanobacteriota bacterium]
MEHNPAPAPLTSVLPHIRLVATDMDGTLTRQGSFTPTLLSTLDALAQANIPVMIVTGRSAGWVQGLVHYLPIVGAIAENGGVFFQKGNTEIHWLVDLPDRSHHRQHLATLFTVLKETHPFLRESEDNRFRLTDWTFDVQGLSQMQITALATTCEQAGWGFTYSTVQCHIRPILQDKGPGLRQVLQRFFPAIGPQQVLTMGDSPNDVGLFDPSQFPHSVGVANVRHYRESLPHQPRFITRDAEVAGFQDVMEQLLAIQGDPCPSSVWPSSPSLPALG